MAAPALTVGGIIRAMSKNPSGDVSPQTIRQAHQKVAERCAALVSAGSKVQTAARLLEADLQRLVDIDPEIEQVAKMDALNALDTAKALADEVGGFMVNQAKPVAPVSEPAPEPEDAGATE